MDQDIPVHEELSPEWEKEIINEILVENVAEPDIIEPADIMTLSRISWRLFRESLNNLITFVESDDKMPSAVVEMARSL